MATKVAEEHVVTDVIVGHSILHMTGPRGHSGNVSLTTTSNGIQSSATVRSATARFTSRKLRVVRMRGVRTITRQTSVFPMTLATNITANMVYCSVLSHLGWLLGTGSLRLSFMVVLEGIAVMTGNSS